MKYAIVYLLKGDVKNYHKRLVNKFSSKFNIQNLNKHIDPHLTLKVPFRTKKIREIENMLKKFVKEQSTSPIKMNKIGHFNRSVLYMKADFSKGANNTYEDFIKSLENISWMRWRKWDKTTERFHATLGYVKGKNKFKEMWDYLQEQKFNFNLEFDNISIIKRPGKRWKTHKIFKINSS